MQSTCPHKKVLVKSKKSVKISLVKLASIKYRFEELLNLDVDIIHAPLDENSMIIPNREILIYAA